MGLFGFIEDSVNEFSCLIDGHTYRRGRCIDCGRNER